MEVVLTPLLKPLSGVLCVCLLRYLWDSFKPSQTGVCRTEYSTSIPAELAQPSAIPVLCQSVTAGRGDHRGQNVTGLRSQWPPYVRSVQYLRKEATVTSNL